MADLVRAAMPDTVADKVVALPAWPVLARRLETWTDEGLPVADLLAGPAGRAGVPARTPAAYAAHLMDKEHHLAQRSSSSSAASTRSTSPTC